MRVTAASRGRPPTGTHQWEAHGIPYLREEPVWGVGERALDIEGGDDHLVGVHVQCGVLEEDGLVGGPAGHGSPHAGGHVGEDRWRDAD